MRITHEVQSQKDKIRENTEKIKVNKTLPYLVSNVIEVRDVIIGRYSVSKSESEKLIYFVTLLIKFDELIFASTNFT